MNSVTTTRRFHWILISFLLLLGIFPASVASRRSKGLHVVQRAASRAIGAHDSLSATTRIKRPSQPPRTVAFILLALLINLFPFKLSRVGACVSGDTALPVLESLASIATLPSSPCLFHRLAHIASRRFCCRALLRDAAPFLSVNDTTFRRHICSPQLNPLLPVFHLLPVCEDTDLTVKLRRHELTDLVVREKNHFLRIAVSILRNNADAEDVVHSSFCAAWKAIAAFREESSMKTWFSRIVSNHALVALRKMRRKTVLFLEDNPEYLHSYEQNFSFRVEDPEKMALRREVLRLIPRHMEYLPTETRVMVALSLFG